MLWSVIVLHVWGTWIVWSMTAGDRDSENLARIFESICFGIGLTLGVLAGDKGIQTLIAARFGQTIEETTTTIKTAQAPEQEGESAIQTKP